MGSHAITLVLIAGFLAPASGAFAAPASPVATPAAGSIGVRLIDAPANRQNDPRARLYIVDHLKPGTTISRRIEVNNGTAQRQSIAVYAAAASINKGAFAVADAHTNNELSSWTTLDRSVANIPADGVAVVRATIKVPKDASPGERYAVVWAEIRGPAAAGGGVTLVNRVGIRIYLSVGPGGEPASNFAITALTAKRLPNGQPVVLATVKNTGGRALEMKGTLKLSEGPGQLTAGPFPATLGTTLAVGDSEPVTIALDKALPNGPWHARIDLVSGFLARSADATITFPTAGAAEPVEPEAGFPWWLIGGLALGLLLLGVLLFFLLRRRRNRQRAEDELAHNHAKHAVA